MGTAGFYTRYNVMTINTIQTFASIRGGLNGECKDVYFIRGVGCGPSYLAEIEAMDRRLWEREQSGRGRYRRVTELPRLSDPDQIAEYQRTAQRWENSGRKELTLKAAACQPALATSLASALVRVQEEFRTHTPNVSSSMETNFVIKLLFWLEQVAGGLLEDWTGRNSDKFVLSGKIKRQEYLFGYLLTLLGIDVMLLLPSGEAEIDTALMKLSAPMILGPGTGTVIPQYRPDRFQAEQERPVNRQSGEAPQNTGTRVKGHAAGAAAGGSRPKVDIRRPDREARRSGTPSATSQPASTSSPSATSQPSQTVPPSTVRPSSPPSTPQPSPRVPSTPARPVVVPAHPGRAAAQHREMEFEELALLASSVVMITVHDQKGDVLGTGSGIMIGPKGFILTNNHVAAGGRFYSVRIEDDEKIYKTDEVIKYNSVQDLAVIRIDRALKPIPLYQGRTPLARGQKVVAIGSPLGLFNSVSNGIISGFRQINHVDMIQFTAPISHGSSGGAVLNMYGEVIGISTAGFDGGQNINLAVEYRCINNFVRGFV